MARGDSQAVRGNPRAPPRGGDFVPDAAPVAGLNVLAAVRAIETLREEPSDANALADAAVALAPVTADADAVSDAMLAAVASLLRLGGMASVGGGRRRRDRSLDAFAAAFASLCARGGGLRADDDAVARAANGAVPFAFYAVADAGVGATGRFSRGGGGPGKGQNGGAVKGRRAAGDPALVAAVRSAASRGGRHRRGGGRGGARVRGVVGG